MKVDIKVQNVTTVVSVFTAQGILYEGISHSIFDDQQS